jgi:hypothetical protein
MMSAPQNSTDENARNACKGRRMKFTLWCSLVLLIGCMEQRAVEQFEAVINRACVTAPTEHSIDQHLHTHVQGCVLVAVEKSKTVGLDATGMTSGVYRTQARSLGFSQYHDEVIIARVADTLAVMTPAAFQVLVVAAGRVHEARAKEEHARTGLGLVLLGSLQIFTAAEPQQLTTNQIAPLRNIL